VSIHEKRNEIGNTTTQLLVYSDLANMGDGGDTTIVLSGYAKRYVNT